MDKFTWGPEDIKIVRRDKVTPEAAKTVGQMVIEYREDRLPVKAEDDIGALLDSEWDAAMEWAKQVVE